MVMKSNGGVFGRNPTYSSVTGGNLKVSGNTIESTDANGDITLDPNGTGRVALAAKASANASSPASYYSDDFVVGAGADGGITIASSATNISGYLMFADGASSDARFRGQIRYNHATDAMTFGTAASGRLTITQFGDVTPTTDGSQNLGAANLRMQTIYAAGGTINTSDARSKQDVADLDAAERRVALKIKALLKTFRFKEAVADKGEAARVHVGVVAQDVAAAFISEGLDPHRYAMFCYDEWEDMFEPVYREEKQLDEKGNEVLVVIDTGELKKIVAAGSRYGIRYEELLSFVIAAI